MNIRKFRATTMRAAMDQVKATLGPEAVILATRELRNGKSPLVEISAAVDRDHGTEALTSRSDAVGESDLMPAPEAILAMQTELREMRLELARHRGDRANRSRSTDQWDRLMAELKDLGRVMGARGAADRDEALSALTMRLVAGGVEHTLARTLTQQVASQWADPAQQTRAVAAHIQDAFAPAPAIWDRDGHTVAALVGPTGVGKTTTMAKIAAHAALGHGRSVALVAADTYRIAGVEQVRNYAGLLGVPWKLARDRAEVQSALEQFRHVDLVLVDTTGRNPWQDASLEQTDQLLRGLPVERHLCVSATSSGADLGKLVGRYEPSGLRSLVITKMDEARGVGNVLSTVWGTDYQIAHITTGQEVPGDIETPNPARLCQAVLG